MIIRMFDENRDVDNFLELFMISFGRPMSREYFDWKYTNNPFRTSIHPIVVVEENDRLIGSRCEIFSRIVIKGTLIYALFGADTMVHPDFRGKGIHGEILRFSQRQYLETPYKFYFGFPNKISLHTNMRSGFLLIHKYNSYWKILNTHEVFNKVFHSPFLQKAGNLLSPLLWYKTRIPKLRNQYVSVKTVNDVKILEDVYNKWKKPDKIYTVRDKTYLTWRFKRHPAIKYQFLAAFFRENIKGYFVISITDFMGMKRGSIVDYIVIDDDPTVFEPLLNYSLYLFKDNNCALVNTWVFTQPWAQKAVKEYGFISSRNILLQRWFSKSYLVVKPVNEQNFPYDISSTEWYITPSDSDTN